MKKVIDKDGETWNIIHVYKSMPGYVEVGLGKKGIPTRARKLPTYIYESWINNNIRVDMS